MTEQANTTTVQSIVMEGDRLFAPGNSQTRFYDLSWLKTQPARGPAGTRRAKNGIFLSQGNFFLLPCFFIDDNKKML